LDAWAEALPDGIKIHVFEQHYREPGDQLSLFPPVPEEFVQCDFAGRLLGGIRS